MTTRFKFIVLSAFLSIASAPILAQTNGAATEEDFSKKKTETKLTEVITTDSLPSGELMKRAVNWIKAEGKGYVKSKGATTSTKAECTAAFMVKPKELNPPVEYTGKVTMKVTIDCKDNKYRYTVSEIKHTSKNGKTTAGSVDNVVPECGSMAMDDITWKKLKGECLRYANQVVAELKTAMAVDSSSAVSTEEW